MAEYSGFFNAKELDTGGYDREYDAEQFADYFSRFISNGVFGNPANNLQIVYMDNSEKPFNVTIKKGSAFIEGYWYELTEDMEVEIPANTQATQAMHTICCTLDKQERKVYIRLRENVVSDLPERTENVFDLVLSRITVQSNASKLNASDIVDRRANNDYCGFVVGLVSQIDTTDLFNQYDSAFNEWFQKVKDQLTEDAAGNLQNQIDGIKTDVETNKTGIKTLDNSFIETTSEVLSNTEQKKIASALAVKGLVDYTPMIPLRGYSGDMNNMPTGTFLCELAKCTNAPSYPMGMWAHVICYAGFSQTAIFYNGNNYPPVIATRTYANNAWTAWAEQAQGFDFASVRINGLISNALQVDLTNPYADVNKPRYVDRAKSTTNMPTNCQWGIREVCQITSNWVMVRITGWSTDSQYAMWTNVYVSSKWQGWDRFSKSEPHVLWTGTGTFDAPTLTLNKNISFFKYYEIIYEVESGNNTVRSTGKIMIGNGATLDGINTKGLLMRRSTNAPSGTSLKLNSGGYFASVNSSASPYSGACCPRRIIGYI